SSSSSAETDTYLLDAESVTVQRDGYEYRCALTNRGGTVYSEPAVLNIVLPDAPVILEQPETVSVRTGTPVSFRISAWGEELTYQWYCRTSPAGTWVQCRSDSANTDTYILDGSSVTLGRNGYEYRCVIRNIGGTVTSQPAALNILLPDIPVITVQPVSQTVTHKVPVVFSIEAAGEELEYQWYYRTSPDGTWMKSTAEDAKTPVYTVSGTSVAYRNGYEYRCEVKNEGGRVLSDPAALTVQLPDKPVIVTQPQSVILTTKKTATFTAEAIGEDMEYQWYYRTSSSGTWMKCTAESALSDTYTVPASSITNERSGYEYRCLVKNEGGRTYSEPAVLTIQLPRKPRILVNPADTTGYLGEEAVFTVEADGDELEYQWYYRTAGNETWMKSTAECANTPVYTVEASKVTSARSGYAYRCVVKNSVGKATSEPAVLTVSVPDAPVITQDPQSLTVLSGTTVSFTVEAEGHALEYQWYYRTAGNETWMKSTAECANTPVYVLDGSKVNPLREDYAYRCVVKNAGGSVYSEPAFFQLYKAVLSLDYPEEVVPEEVSVIVHHGYPTGWSSRLSFTKTTSTTVMSAEEDGTYIVAEPGVYCYYVQGEGYYKVIKLFLVKEEDIERGSLSVTVETSKAAKGENGYAGYQPTIVPENAPEGYKTYFLDDPMILWNDEILEHFRMEDTTQSQVYKTPSFTGEDAAHEFTTDEEMADFLEERASGCEDMYVYSLGKTPHYQYDLPLVLFTKTQIPADSSLEDAAELLRQNGKITVWYQAQIHPNEPAAGEGALVIIDDFCTNHEGAANLLENINLVIVPRVNPESSYLFHRLTYDKIDMNRDHLALRSEELVMVHAAYRLFMPEVTIDAHEYPYFGGLTETETGKGYTYRAYDAETTPATSLMHAPAVNALALEMCGAAFTDAKDAGLRVYHYGTTTDSTIGRAYYGLFNSVSFLVETAGIGAGKSLWERRIFAQETIILSYIRHAAERHEEIMEAVSAARENTVAKGKIYGEEDDLIYLQHGKTGDTVTEFTAEDTKYYLDGTLKSALSHALALEDTGLRTRKRPTAYLIPSNTENLEKILQILENHGAEYYYLSGGAEIPLEQYYFLGLRNGAVNAKDIEAGLREESDIAFPEGAYVIPMDQTAANVIAVLMEPDITDTINGKGSLFQQDLLGYEEESGNFPLYRYTKEDPRTALLGQYSGE
ncbi:MAG: hypothetical protein IIU06_01600, partial [Erysipelotrichales bacterium]|nr:hypothetical protein [Erysipelotrichales bacterium]